MYKQFNFPNTQFVDSSGNNLTSSSYLFTVLQQGKFSSLNFKENEGKLEGMFLIFFSEEQQKQIKEEFQFNHPEKIPLLAILKGKFKRSGVKQLTLKPLHKKDSFESCYGYLEDRNRYRFSDLVRGSWYWDMGSEKIGRFYKIQGPNYIWRVE